MKHFTITALCVAAVGATAWAASPQLTPSEIFGNRLLKSIAATEDGYTETTTLDYTDAWLLAGYTSTDDNASCAIDYTAGTIDGYSYDLVISYSDSHESYDCYILLNSDGFAGSAYTKGNDEGEKYTETATFEYNEHYQLTKITEVDSDGSKVTTIEYSELSISKITEKDSWETCVWTYVYTDDQNPNPIENQSGFMLADITYEIDYDPLLIGYLAGIFGEPVSVFLPIKEIDQSDNDWNAYAWTLDDNGYPSSLTISDDDPSDANTLSFTWVEVAGISSVGADKAVGPDEYYSVSGIRKAQADRGLSIVRHADGSSQIIYTK